jgi:acyl dehydratase
VARPYLDGDLLPKTRERRFVLSDFTIAEISEHVGRELGVSDWVTIEQSRIDNFADCTGDRQWIHVDVERAKRESPFRGPIAHGYLMLSMVAPLSMEIGIIPKDSAAGLNYGIDKVRFLAPVPAGARVRLRVVLTGVEPREGGQAIMKTQNTLEVEGSQKPALIAETLALVIPAKGTATQRARNIKPTPQPPTIYRIRRRGTLWRSIHW